MPRALARKDSDISLYRQAASILREQIADGVLPPGARLPAEEALRRQFGMSRGTLRQALDALDREGLIERAPGRGTFVRASARESANARSHIAWPKLVGCEALSATRLTREGVAVPPFAVTRALGLPKDTELPFFIRLSRARGSRAVGLKRYLHPDLAAQAPTLAAASDFDGALAGLGAADLGASWIEAILAEPRFAMQLKVPLGAPLLSIWWVHLLDGAPAACSQMLRPGTGVAVDLPRDSLP